MQEQTQAPHSATRRTLEPEKVDLKFLFDHVRNYGIAGSILAVAVLVSARGTQYATILPARAVISLFGFLGITLMMLNFIQGVYALKAVLRMERHGRWLALFWLLLLISAVEFTLEVMKQTNWSTWT